MLRDRHQTDIKMMKIESSVLESSHIVTPNYKRNPVIFELAGNHFVLPVKTK